MSHKLDTNRAMHDGLCMPEEIELIGTTESCRVLGVDKSTLTRWAADGTITVAHRLPGKNGALLFRRTDIEALHSDRLRNAAAS